MITYLENRQKYEDRYDRMTVDICRRNERMVIEAYHKAKQNPPKLTGKDKDKDPQKEMLKIFNVYHYFATEWEAGERWLKRKDTIQEWMDEDAAKDQQLEDARLTVEPVCQHCGKTGLRIISKDLVHRGEDYKWDDPEEVLIMLECTHCHKRSAYWEDGSPWERRHTYCPKCKTIMTEKSTVRGKVHTTAYSCPKCGHAYKDRFDYGKHDKVKEKPDPDFEKDKIRFCLNDKQGEEFIKTKANFEGMKRMVDGWKERDANKEIYDAMNELKKPNIAQLTELLKPPIEKAGYTEFNFDKPEMGRDVFIGFSCLDSKADRDDYDSRGTLKKLVDKALADTNWRLTTDGVGYRLGYLTGRLHAYEREEDLQRLVMREKKLKLKKIPKEDPDNGWRIKDKTGRDIIL